MMKKFVTLAIAFSLVSAPVSAFNLSDAPSAILDFVYDKKFVVGVATGALIIVLAAKQLGCTQFSSIDVLKRLGSKSNKKPLKPEIKKNESENDNK